MAEKEIEVRVKILENFDPDFSLPSYQTLGASGVDVRSSFLEKRGIIISPGTRVLIPTGLSVEIPVGYEIQVRPRSGLSLKTNLMLVNSPGTIDSDYRGEIKIILGNFGREDFLLEHGERIAQLVLVPVSKIRWIKTDTDLGTTERGSGGFGHTGTK